jgi:hypothetical protein
VCAPPSCVSSCVEWEGGEAVEAEDVAVVAARAGAAKKAKRARSVRRADAGAGAGELGRWGVSIGEGVCV